MVNTPTSGENDASGYILGFMAGWTLSNGGALNGAIRHVAPEEENGDHFVDWRPSVVLRIPLDARWTVHAEYFALFSDQREENLHAHYLSPGLRYLLTPDCELGSRFGVGLTDDLAAALVNVGMAVRC